MYYFLVFQNRNCHQKEMIPEIGIGVVPIVVYQLNAMKWAIKILCFKANAKVDK